MAVSTMSSTSSHVVRRPRSELEAKMTCPLCNKLFEEATTISECLDTFCKKCIYDKIVDEELDSCPKCNAHLGVAPLEKLRPDNNWRTLRDKMFPPEKTKVEEQAVAPDPVSPIRKERLISSLTDTPCVSSRSETHRRKRHPTRRIIPAQDCIQSVEKQEKEEENFRERLKSPETPKNAPSTPQNFEEGSSMQQMLHKGVQDGKADLLNSLNRPVEAEKTSSDIPVAAPVLPDLPNIDRLEIRETEGNGNENESIPATSGARPLRKSQRVKKKDAVVADLNIPAPVVAANAKSHIRGAGFWFSLVTSNQDGYAPLPQIPSGYLRVKDGSLPVSYIKRYLVQKLNLTSEAEVEIFLRGQPVIPTLQLHNLADLWVRTTPTSQRVMQGSVGSSGKEYVMVLTYARKCADSIRLILPSPV